MDAEPPPAVMPVSERMRRAVVGALGLYLMLALYLAVSFLSLDVAFVEGLGSAGAWLLLVLPLLWLAFLGGYTVAARVRGGRASQSLVATAIACGIIGVTTVLFVQLTSGNGGLVLALLVPYLVVMCGVSWALGRAVDALWRWGAARQA